MTLVVANDAGIQTDLASLQFAYQIGQALPGAQTVSVTSTTGALLNYTLASAETSCTGVQFLPVYSSAVQQTPSTFQVQLQNLVGIPPGTCAGNITITATNPATGAPALNSPLVIPVKLFISNNPLLTSNPTALNFMALQGGVQPAVQTITVGATSGAALNYSVGFTTSSCGNNWLLLSGLTGSTRRHGQNTIGVTVNPNPSGSLPAGTCRGTITVSATADNSPLVIPVTLQITAGTLSLATNTLTFSQTAGSAAPPSQTVAVSSGGGQAINYTAQASTSNGVNWLSVTPSGTTPGTLTVSVDSSKLTTGQYTGTIT